VARHAGTTRGPSFRRHSRTSARYCSFCSGSGSPPRMLSTLQPSAILPLQTSLISQRRVLTTPEGLVAHHCRLRRRASLFAVRGPCAFSVVFLSVDARTAMASCDRRGSGRPLRAVMENPVPMAAWGPELLRVLLVIGFATVLRRSRCRSAGARSCHLASFIGRWVEPDPKIPPEEQPRPPIGHRYAADFPGLSLPVES